MITSIQHEGNNAGNVMSVSWMVGVWQEHEVGRHSDIYQAKREYLATRGMFIVHCSRSIAGGKKDA